VSDEIEALQEQIAALQARLKPLLAEQKEERRKEAAEKAGARLDRRRSRIAQMMEWHETGLSYREIAQRMALSRDYVAQLIKSERSRRRMGQRIPWDAERRAP